VGMVKCPMMKDTDLLQLALGLNEPWFVEKSDFDMEQKRFDIFLDFKKGSMFTCPECGRSGKVHDTVEKTWKHLNFFQHETYLHARTPRMRCDEHGVKLVEVVWARKQSGFTLLFEALVMAMMSMMPVNAVAKQLGVTDKRLWRILEHYVGKDLAAQDLSTLAKVGIDETSTKKGHNYVSLFVDMDKSKVVFVTEGKDAATVERFAQHLTEHRGDPKAITEASIDMSPAFITGVAQHLPKASITFDKFHVIKLLNKAVDDIRKEERRTEPLLKSTRYLWLKNPGNLSHGQAIAIASLAKLKLKTARAYRMRLVFQEAFTLSEPYALTALEKWFGWAIRSRLKPIIEFAKMLKRHWEGIVRWFKSRLTNAVLEGLNSLVQAAKARARGYRTLRNFKIMIYLVAGKLGLLST
jgi:transposase